MKKLQKFAIGIGAAAVFLAATPGVASAGGPAPEPYPGGWFCAGAGGDTTGIIALNNWLWSTTNQLEASQTYFTNKSGTSWVNRGYCTNRSVDIDGYFIPPGWYAMENYATDTYGYRYRENGGVNGRGIKLNDAQHPDVILCPSGKSGNACIFN